MRIVIIEDELAAAKGLQRMLKEIDSKIEIVATLKSVESAIEWFNSSTAPDLIFLDIQLKDGLSFEIFDQVKTLVPIIFCTAFDHFAVRAFELNSIDYLLKPYTRASIKKALDKYKQLSESPLVIDYQLLAQSIKDASQGYKKSFLVKAGRKLYRITEEQIAYFYTRHRVNYIKTTEDKAYIIDDFLDDLEAAIHPKKFFRINRQYILNITSIKTVENDYGRLTVFLEPSIDDNVFVSRGRVQDFKDWFGG
jgi:DNA-binding LytR/AlgR family response regulator